MYHVLWIQTALDEMALLWMNADSAIRLEINRAANLLDYQLQKDPFAISESRDPGEWVAFVDPLGVLAEIDANQKTVWILSVWRFR